MAADGPRPGRHPHQGPNQHPKETVDQIKGLQSHLKPIKHILDDLHTFSNPFLRISGNPKTPSVTET